MDLIWWYLYSNHFPDSFTVLRCFSLIFSLKSESVSPTTRHCVGCLLTIWVSHHLSKRHLSGLLKVLFSEWIKCSFFPSLPVFFPPFSFLISFIGRLCKRSMYFVCLGFFSDKWKYNTTLVQEVAPPQLVKLLHIISLCQ